MKKLLALSLFLFLASQMFGQASGSTITFLPNETLKNVTVAGNDTVAGVGTKYWDFAINKPKLQYFIFALELDTTLLHNRVQGNRVLVQTFGALSQSGTWRQIGSNIFYNVNAGTNGDTTMLVGDVSTGVLYKYLRIKFTGIVANKCVTIASLGLKVADK